MLSTCRVLYSRLAVCYRFGRNIGFLSKSIKQTKHPGKHLALQYKRKVAASNCHQEEPEEKPDEENSHPLIPLGAVSSTTAAGAVIFPELSRYVQVKMPVYRTSDERLRGGLLPILGLDVVAEGRVEVPGGKAESTSVYTLVHSTHRVQVGPWSYSCAQTEDLHDRLSGSSWFRMRICNVPHRFEKADLEELRTTKSNQFVYGRIQHFAKLTVPVWPKEDFRLFHLAKCVLYNPDLTSDVTKLEFVALDEPLKFILAGYGRKESECYIQLRYLETQVAEAPFLKWSKVNQSFQSKVFKHWRIMLPMQK